RRSASASIRRSSGSAWCRAERRSLTAISAWLPSEAPGAISSSLNLRPPPGPQFGARRADTVASPAVKRYSSARRTRPSKEERVRVQAARLGQLAPREGDVAVSRVEVGCGGPQAVVTPRVPDCLVPPAGGLLTLALGVRDECKLEIGACSPRLD